ncbi:hypothetical protein HELRODRAFT_175106 [Helobdella robusta]|uniref:SUEL-type lectin domain-containing protein n=1 Tax=Helobdella robusta TaxID=6412 RepID=T1F8V1_HELRO|nr:hypothetical protein HELRODRAFT_175106 [Helobdella robusta]ESO01079.1 hypothetical protein HELRODRAFT_175106 [Helobdella robusta]
MVTTRNSVAIDATIELVAMQNSSLPLWEWAHCLDNDSEDDGSAAALEYCQFETFNASCVNYTSSSSSSPPSSSSSFSWIILIEKATYGRMRTGRCVAKDYGHIGCSNDVSPILDAMCSGKFTCSVPVPTLRSIIQPCPKDLISYLNVSYRCVSGKIVGMCGSVG